MSRWDPVTAKVLDLWPLPNRNVTGPVSNYTGNVSNSQDMNAFDVKGDYQFERAGRLFVRESYSKSTLDTKPPANPFMAADPDSKQANHNAVAGYSASIRPHILNELRLGSIASIHSISAMMRASIRTIF